MKDFNMPGIWKLPGATDDGVVGNLSFSKEQGFTLDVPCGHLGTSEQFVERVNTGEDIPVIEGFLRDGKIVTLTDCYPVRTSISFPGGATECYRSSLGFVGDGPCVPDPVIDKVVARFDHLKDWVVRHPAKAKQPLENKQLRPFPKFCRNSRLRWVLT